LVKLRSYVVDEVLERGRQHIPWKAVPGDPSLSDIIVKLSLEFL
jgi:hypothetical protein